MMKRVVLAVMTAGALAGASQPSYADYLVVKATGTVTSDFDTANIFGFGVTPESGVNSFPGAAAGQAVSMDFVLNLNEVPPDVCANNACFETGTRAYYFTNSVPAADWVVASSTIGGRNVPDLALGGKNIAYSEGIVPQLGGSESLADVWTAYGSLPTYNELDLESSAVQQITGNFGLGAQWFAESSDTSFLRIDDIANPILKNLSLNQTFSWSSAMDDGDSSALLIRQLDVGVCQNGTCTTDSVANAEAFIKLTSATASILPAPEIDPSKAFGSITMLLAVLAMMRGSSKGSGASPNMAE